VNFHDTGLGFVVFDSGILHRHASVLSSAHKSELAVAQGVGRHALLAGNKEAVRQLHGAPESTIEECADRDVHAPGQLLNSAYKDKNSGGELVAGGFVNFVSVCWVSAEDGVVDGKHRT